MNDGPVAVELSLVSSEAEPGLVRLIWYAADGASLNIRVERRTEASDWERLDSITPDGTGYLSYEDRTVAAGIRYGYRLAYPNGGTIAYSSETWVEVPASAVFALERLHPNPAIDDLRVVFSLPSAEPARLELYDLSGRRVLDREVGSLGAGAHRVDLSVGLHLPAGVYHLSQTQGSRRATQRAIVMR